MIKVWIVVANSTQSKIYRAEDVNTLVEMKAFEHMENRLTKFDLNADRDGRQTHRVGYGTDTYQEQTPVRVKESSNFAKEIALYLEEGFNSGTYDRIYLVAKPPFLGFLRQSFSSNVSKLVASEVHKDLTQLAPKQIREYLPPVL